MSRRAAAGLGVLVAGCLIAGLGPSTAGGQDGETPDPSATISRDIGQMLVGRMRGRRPSPSLLRRVRRGELGGVILFADNVRSVAQVRSVTADLQRSARAGGNPPVLVAMDQEGGLVRRLRHAPPTLSPAQMGRSRRPAQTAAAQGRRTAAALRRAGVTVNLAPVADVPTVRDSFLGSRAFGRSPELVARAACGFLAGLIEGRMAGALKHFPGLGAARSNTDLRPTTIRASASDLRAAYEPYERCASGPRRLVMVSSASYASLTGSVPAVLSTAIYDREVPRVGFRGPTISDDLEAGALRGQRDVAVRAARAGLDLQLWAQAERASGTAHRRLRDAVQSGRLSRGRVRQAAARVRAFKRGT